MVRFERDLELHDIRREIFDTDVVRIWERRSLALDTVGDGLFLLFARDHAPLAERLEAITGRLEDVPGYLEASKTRATVPQVRLWQGIEMETAAELPNFFDEIAAAAEGRPGRRPNDAAWTGRSPRPRSAIELYGGLARGHARRPAATTGRSGVSATTSWSPIGRSTAWMPTPSWSSAGSSWPRRRPRASRRRARSTPTRRRRRSSIGSSPTQPADFDAALDAYRDAMLRARAHLIDHDLVTVPDDERIEVIATPEYLRNVLPFAAYFSPANFDRDAKGIYIVTPVGRQRPARDARAQPRLDQQHEHPRGVPGPPPAARRRPPAPVADPPA